MPKMFPEEQRNLVCTLAADGLSNVEIAKKMKEDYPADWSSQYAHRTVARILKDGADADASEAGVDPNKTLDEMSRDERFRFVEGRVQQTPRFRMAFRNFDQEDKGVFVDEYLNIMRSTETITEVEEQALFAAILELVLGLKALNRKEQEEKFRDQSLAGDIPEGDARYRTHVSDKYQKEYDQHMKLHNKGVESLKMSRKDRLKEVRSQKISLVDMAEDLSHKNAQSEVADEIARLSKLKDEELERLLELGHIHGVFDEFA